MKKKEIQKKYNDKIKLIKKYNASYYDKSNPIVDDEVYDNLKKDILKLETDYSFLKSEELKVYNIGFQDVKEDMRYSKWGIHPVDIRSKLNKEKRPIQGALLGIEDSEKFTRLTKTRFLLEHIRKKNNEDAINFLGSKKVEKFDAILLDLNIQDLKYYRSILKKRPNTIFFNISCR